MEGFRKNRANTFKAKKKANIMGKAIKFLFAFFLLLVLGLFIIFSFVKFSGGGLFLNNLPDDLQNSDIVADNGSIAVYFCQQEDCDVPILKLIQNSKISIDCALYDLDYQSFLAAFSEKISENVQVRIVVDKDNSKGLEGNVFSFDDNNQLMHDKFCIFDDSVIFTGSMNPTENDVLKNDNNLIVIDSKVISSNYKDEFYELWNGDFGKGLPVRFSSINLSTESGNILVENYFCAEDNCEQKVLEKLQSAQKSIYFMTFSFTSDVLGDVLIKKANQGVTVEGVFDESQFNSQKQFSEYMKLREANLNVSLDKSKYKLHHKVFIIDNKTVIAGSFNPTKNGNEENDENIVILHDEGIALQYLREFDRIQLMSHK